MREGLERAAVVLLSEDQRPRGYIFFSSSKSNTLPFPLILTQGNDYA